MRIHITLTLFCALQVLSKSRPGQSRERTAGKLRREAECMAAVQECDGVVSLRGLFEDVNSAYFVMDHCSGGDLEQLVQVCVHPFGRGGRGCACGRLPSAWWRRVRLASQSPHNYAFSVPVVQEMEER